MVEMQTYSSYMYACITITSYYMLQLQHSLYANLSVQFAKIDSHDKQLKYNCLDKQSTYNHVFF